MVRVRAEAMAAAAKVGDHGMLSVIGLDDATLEGLVADALKARCWGPGFLVPGSGFRVPGSGFRVPGSGFRVLGSGRQALLLRFCG